MLAATLITGAGMTSCVDDGLVDKGSGNNGIYDVDEDEYALGVTISLSQLTSTSTRSQLGGALSDLAGAGLKDIEEYVNTDNLYILFFNLDGTFLFQIDKPVAVPIGKSELGNDCQWFIRIPVKTIAPSLIQYIEENPFKIAVLANWTFDSDLNLGGNLSGWEEFVFHEPIDENGNLVYDEFGKLQGDHISMLTHAQRDTAYESSALKGGYDHLVYRKDANDYPHMGPYTEWVGNYHKNIAEAESNIRKYFDVKNNIYQNPNNFFYDEAGNLTALDHFDTKYNNIWHLWNFGGNDDSRFGSFPDMGETQKTDWLALNEKAKNEFIANYDPNADVNLWKMNNYQDLELSRGVVPMVKEGDSPGTYDVDGFVIRDPNMSWSDHEAGNPLILTSSTYDRHPFIHFKAHADGYVRVNYEATGGAKLYVHIGTNNTPQNNASGYQKDNLSNREECTVGDGGQFGDVPFEPKDVWIYMVAENQNGSGELLPDEGIEDGDGDGEGDAPTEVPPTTVNPMPTVKIYSIEYIESRHLYDVDRRAILPSKEYPIPMYGVQDFDPIGEYWEPGILFNLSQYNNAQKAGYYYRNISLLRSISRVEVKLLKEAFPKKPAHVYLRSMNRSARITPVDIFTPTDIIWNGFNSSSPNDVRRLQNYIDVGNLDEQRIIQNTPGVEGEIKNIMQYGPFYIGNKTAQSGNKLNEYRRTTSWPFGIWEHQWGWDWNRDNGIVDNFNTYQVGDVRAYTGQTVPEYPRILHTRISRSDYSHFAEVDDPKYWHYIIYIPEKNITDADNPGDISDRPKIIHVELRFNGGLPGQHDDEENMVDNFDDKAAYRLYFTEGGRANLGNFQWSGRDSWDDYEYDWDIVKQHWPILRNHEYIFTVTGAPSNSGNVNLQVSAPDQRYTGWTFY